MVRVARVFVALIVPILFVTSIDAQKPSSDWTQWRGPNRDGVAPPHAITHSRGGRCESVNSRSRNEVNVSVNVGERVAV